MTEKEQYFNILCNNDYPKFIDKYINTKELKRLDSIGLFCGCDYTKLYSMKFWYSRLDHSIATALITWNFSKSKVQTLSALFHDLGTPSFSHTIDYLLKDSENQEKSEKNIKDIVFSSKNLLKLLKDDNINIEDVIDVSKYSIVENKSPKICADRLDGILSTGLIWSKFWSLENIKRIYNDIVILENEDYNEELGFLSLKTANYFMQGVYKYSIELQKNKNKFFMQFIADNIKYLIYKKEISFEDLYNLSEKQIIAKIILNKDLKNNWYIFEDLTTIKKSNIKIKNKYCVAVKSKKRYVIPLVIVKTKKYRLNKVSVSCSNLLDKYNNFNDKKYSYSDKIDSFNNI
ncbi:MAG: hypothetical protein GX758_00895 [Tenericutes bacterium]|nr:hypothetical protein [Mycoplasmatota bacterium]